MEIRHSDSDYEAEITGALKAIVIPEKQLEDLRRLYETPLGFSYTVDTNNRPQAQTISSCGKVGSSIKKALGITSAGVYGMNFIGYCDPQTVTWRMRDNFRAALEGSGLIEPLNEDRLATIQSELQVRVEKSQFDSAAARKERLAKAPRIPRRVLATTYVYDRNPDVIAETLARSRGKCEGCGKSAPFLKKSNGEPYLEVHHRVQLSSNGEDTVENAIALCPNCHRKSHFG